MGTLRTYWNNIKKMPFLLGMLCQGGTVAGPIALVFVMFPVADWTFYGKQMSYSQFWTSGAGLVSGIFVSLVMIGTWGMAARNPISRWALVIAPLVLSVVGLVFPTLRSTVPFEPFFLLEQLLTAAIIYGCLFHLPSIQEFFRSGHKSAWQIRGQTTFYMRRTDRENVVCPL